MYGALDISVSGMVAQRTRQDVSAANIANADAIQDPSGETAPFRRRIALLAAEGRGRNGRPGGVRVAQIIEDQSPARKVYDRSHPLAAKRTDPDRDMVEGYVNFPNVNPVIEQMNSMEAARAYEANIAAAEATKSMLNEALRLLA
jgi:flagellar basal-body rod protein FlgC